jgi:glyoxylase-like metal-dependent hydrolase (beta-lactamase superfamily II)
MSNIYLGRVLITISIPIIMMLMVPQIVVSQGNQSALSNSTMLKTDYAPVPENARGPTIPEKGYVIEDLGENLYFLSNGAYNTIFMVTNNGVIAIDAPPAIGENYLKAISEVTDNPVTHFIYSHTHTDHVGAANIFPDNATYIAHEDTANQLKLSNDTNRPLPNITFTDGYDLKVGNETVLSLGYHGVTHEPGNIFMYAPKQKTLMLVDVIYPGWVPFDGLGGSENITGFIEVPNTIMNNYDLENFVGGHLTRLGTVDDIRMHQEFIQDLKATAQQVLQNVSFGDIAKVVGPANPGNPWSTTNTYLEAINQQCTKEMSDKWQNRLGGVDIFMDDNCAAMLKSLRLD